MAVEITLRPGKVIDIDGYLGDLLGRHMPRTSHAGNIYRSAFGRHIT